MWELNPLTWSQGWELLLIEVQYLLVHIALHLYLISAHSLVILHWSLLLAPCLLILHWLTIVLLIWLAHITDVTGSSEPKVIVVASLARPTITFGILLSYVCLLLWVSIIWRSGPFISKSLVIFTTSIFRRCVRFFKIFLNRGWVIFIRSFGCSLDFLLKFGLCHVFWFSIAVFVILIFLASVALLSTFEVVILALWTFPTTLWEVETSSFWIECCYFFRSVWLSCSWNKFLHLSNWFEVISTWLKSWSIDCRHADILWSWWHVQSLLCENRVKFRLIVWSCTTWVFIGRLVRMFVWEWRVIKIEFVEVVNQLCVWAGLLIRFNRLVAVDDIEQISSNGSALSRCTKNGVIEFALWCFFNEVLVEFRIKFNSIR